MSFLIPLRLLKTGSIKPHFHVLLRVSSHIPRALSSPSVLPIVGLSNQYHSISLIGKHQFPSATIVFVQKRNFGRDRKIPRFGHGPEPEDGPVAKFLMFFIMVSIFCVIIDWEAVKNDYGINIRLFTEGFTGKPDPQVEKYYPSSLPLVLEEKKSEIHQFMKEEAAKRALQESKSDPEILAILEGRENEIKPVNPEDFQEKKEFVKRITSVLSKANLKAETIDLKFLSSDSDDDDDDFHGVDKKNGFRNRKIIEYENRIRQYSTPDKIFRYFATYRLSDEKGHVEAMMTPEDFLRSITPGMKQPENLGLDQFINLNGQEVNRLSPQLGVEEDSIFHQLGSGGLISFSDYIFLLTVLSTSRRHFEIAFKMFDLNGDGNVDAKEFEVVTNLMRSQSSTGIRHRDHTSTGSTFKGINSGLNNYFFGEDREGILTVEKFLDFQRKLQNEILKLEFNRKIRECKKHDNKKSESDQVMISEKDFAELLIAYAGFTAKKKTRMIKRVKKYFGGSLQEGITLEDFLNFYQVLYAINDIDTALTFYTIAGAPIERATMKHVAQTVAGVQLSDHIIDVVFILFDENGDGKLSNKEFVSVMKQRAMRGLEKPKDTGIGKIFSAMTKCASDSRPTIIGGIRKTE